MSFLLKNYFYLMLKLCNIESIPHGIISCCKFPTHVFMFKHELMLS